MRLGLFLGNAKNETHWESGVLLWAGISFKPVTYMSSPSV